MEALNGASRTTSSWLSPFWDSTSALSVGRGEVAVGSERLFTSDESREPLDEASSRALGGLHDYIQRQKILCNKGTP